MKQTKRIEKIQDDPVGIDVTGRRANTAAYSLSSKSVLPMSALTSTRNVTFDMPWASLT